MAKKVSTIYFVVRVSVEHDEFINGEDVLDEVNNNVDYSFNYETDYMKIIDTEIVGNNPLYINSNQ